VPEYDLAFRTVFRRPINGTDLVRAIASDERSQFSFDPPFDHFIGGIEQFPASLGGIADRYFMDNDFHNIGIGILRQRWSSLPRQERDQFLVGRLPRLFRLIGFDEGLLGKRVD